MCTALSFQTRDHYFGRTLDLEFHYDERVAVTPRNMPFHFRRMGDMPRHHALIGMATVVGGVPLYYEATNEKGLSMAGLNFPGNAFYPEETEGKDNVAPFELIPWILGQCDDLAQARKLVERVNVIDLVFSEGFPTATLHWMIADRTGSLVVESMADGLHIHDNPVGVMTNNPPFPMQMMNLANYMNLSREPAVNRMAPGLDLTAYSRGMGAMGLPGDLSSASRFVKCAFTRLNSLCGDDELSIVSQFFHILGSVEQQRGCVHMGEGKYELTIYTSCCNTDTGTYYYTTYENQSITGVNMFKENLESDAVIAYPLRTEQRITMEN